MLWLGRFINQLATHLAKKAGYSNKTARTGAVTLIRK
jgi:phage terminase small subunit